MKKFALLTLLISINIALFSVAYAHIGAVFCSIILIDIANQTTSPCILLQKRVSAGKLNREKNLEEIPAGKEISEFVSLGSDFNADVTLSYMCGEGMATFDIHKDACMYGGKSNATLTSIAGMHANYTIFPGTYDYIVELRHGNLTSFDLPGVVKWTFSES